MHLPNPQPLLLLLTTLSISLSPISAATTPSNPPTSPYIITALARWELRTLTHIKIPFSTTPSKPSSAPSLTLPLPQTQQNQTLPSLQKRHRSPIDYPIPETTTKLIIRLTTRPIPEATVQGVIAASHSVADNLIEKVGDHTLPATAEPWLINPEEGAYVIALSRYPQHLTFGIVRNAMQGLWDNLVGDEEFFT